MKNQMNYKLINMKVLGDEMGKYSLIKRVYWLFDIVSYQNRGMYTHNNMEQIIAAMLL